MSSSVRRSRANRRAQSLEGELELAVVEAVFGTFLGEGFSFVAAVDSVCSFVVLALTGSFACGGEGGVAGVAADDPLSVASTMNTVMPATTPTAIAANVSHDRRRLLLLTGCSEEPECYAVVMLLPRRVQRAVESTPAEPSVEGPGVGRGRTLLRSRGEPGKLAFDLVLLDLESLGVRTRTLESRKAHPLHRLALIWIVRVRGEQ